MPIGSVNGDASSEPGPVPIAPMVVGVLTADLSQWLTEDLHRLHTEAQLAGAWRVCEIAVSDDAFAAAFGETPTGAVTIRLAGLPVRCRPLASAKHSDIVIALADTVTADVQYFGRALTAGLSRDAAGVYTRLRAEGCPARDARAACEGILL